MFCQCGMPARRLPLQCPRHLPTRQAAHPLNWSGVRSRGAGERHASGAMQPCVWFTRAAAQAVAGIARAGVWGGYARVTMAPCTGGVARVVPCAANAALAIPAGGEARRRLRWPFGKPARAGVRGTCWSPTSPAHGSAAGACGHGVQRCSAPVRIVLLPGQDRCAAPQRARGRHLLGRRYRGRAALLRRGPWVPLAPGL